MTYEVRHATADDAATVGQMLHDFNSEYDETTPGPERLAQRIRELLEDGDTTALLVGDPPEGFAILRFRRAITTPGLECYLAELYVKPDLRGEGRGQALMEAALKHARERGADYMDLNTSEDDTMARALYERLGFTNREGGPEGPLNYYYERELER